MYALNIIHNGHVYNAIVFSEFSLAFSKFAKLILFSTSLVELFLFKHIVYKTKLHFLEVTTTEQWGTIFLIGINIQIIINNSFLCK